MHDPKEVLEICEKATRPIPGYPGYEADNEGNIWSMQHNWRGYGPRVLTALQDKNGYLKVRLSINGKRINRKIHRLVCLAFHGQPSPEKPLVRHLDGNKHNNSPDNLCWGSHQENEHDAVLNGEKASGERNGFSKLTEIKVKEIKAMLSNGVSQRKIAKQYGISQRNVSLINQGKGWRSVV
jgi:hypothetical protein